MAQPILLYRVADGEALTVYAPRFAAELVAAGEYSYEPVMVEAPAAPVLPADETATEAPAEAHKPAPARRKRQGQAL